MMMMIIMLHLRKPQLHKRFFSLEIIHSFSEKEKEFQTAWFIKRKIVGQLLILSGQLQSEILSNNSGCTKGVKG